MTVSTTISASEVPLTRHLGTLTRYARALTRSGPEEAEDLVQETMEKALARARRGVPPENAEAYLIRTCRNLHRDQLRRRRRAPVSPSEPVPETESPAAGPEMALACADVLAAMDRLPAAQRRLLRMAAFDGMSYRDMADRLDVPVGTVTSRLARARAALAEATGWDGRREI